MRLLKRNMLVTCDIHASTAMVSAMVSCASKPEVTTINDKSGHCRLSRHFYCIRAIFVWPWKMNLVSVRYLFYQSMDEKIKTWTLRFPAKENTNMEKALFDWPIVLQYDVKAKYPLIFTRAFAEPTKRHSRLYPFDKPIKSLYSRSLVFMFCCTFSIQSHKKIALLEIFQYRNSHDLYVLMYPSVKIRPCPHESERCKITQFCTQNKSGSENNVSCMS